MELLLVRGGVTNSKLQKIRSFLEKKATRAVNPFSKLKVLNLDDTCKLSVLTFMHGYWILINDNLPSTFQNMIKSLAEPKRTKSYKLEQVLNKI